MEIKSVGTAAAPALSGTLLPAVEGRLNNLLKDATGEKLRHGMEDLIRQLPPDQREIVVARLNDANDPLTQSMGQQMPASDMQSLLGVLNNQGHLLAQLPQTIHSMAARGDLDAMNMADQERFTMDQWNAIRARGNPPELPPIPEVNSTQADAMLGLSGLDRSKPISVKDYLDLINKTTPDAIRARAAQGDAAALEFDDGSQFTINQWNHLRSHGNPPDVAGTSPVSAELTDAMVAAGGIDPDTPITASRYLELMRQSTSGTIHARAASGDPEAVTLDDNSQFTIDEWNSFRAANPDLEISAEQTDAMLAQAGVDRETPLSVKDYLRLIAKTRVIEASEENTKGPANEQLETKILAARMRIG